MDFPWCSPILLPLRGIPRQPHLCLFWYQLTLLPIEVLPWVVRLVHHLYWCGLQLLRQKHARRGMIRTQAWRQGTILTLVRRSNASSTLLHTHLQSNVSEVSQARPSPFFLLFTEKLNIPHFIATSGNDWRVYCKESGIWKSRDGVKPPQCTAVSENINISVSTSSSSFFVFSHKTRFLFLFLFLFIILGWRGMPTSNVTSQVWSFHSYSNHGYTTK